MAAPRETRTNQHGRTVLFCPGCEEWRVEGLFPSDRRNTTGRKTHCMSCAKKKRRTPNNPKEYDLSRIDLPAPRIDEYMVGDIEGAYREAMEEE